MTFTDRFLITNLFIQRVIEYQHGWMLEIMVVVDGNGIYIYLGNMHQLSIFINKELEKITVSDLDKNIIHFKLEERIKALEKMDEVWQTVKHLDKL